MKPFGFKFILSLPFTVGAIVLLLAHMPLFAAISGVIAFAFNIMEVKHYSTYYQFINFRVHTLALGYALDVMLGQGNYWFTFCMFLTPLAGVVRLELFNIMLVKNYVWVELLGIIGMYGTYLYANLQHPTRWEGWMFPLVPILFMTMIGAGIAKEPKVYPIGKEQKSEDATENKEDTVLGQPAPQFTLKNVEGKDVSLSDFENKHNVLLIFVRGDWCPTCHMMIRAYERNRDKFLEKNIIPIGISPDGNEVNQKMMERLGFSNMLLSDTKQETAFKYGILFKGNSMETKYEHGIALPASFLIDKTGMLRYMSRSDRAGEFLSPDLIFPVIESLA